MKNILKNRSLARISTCDTVKVWSQSEFEYFLNRNVCEMATRENFTICILLKFLYYLWVILHINVCMSENISQFSRLCIWLHYDNFTTPRKKNVEYFPSIARIVFYKPFVLIAAHLLSSNRWFHTFKSVQDFKMHTWQCSNQIFFKCNFSNWFCSYRNF